MNQYHSLLRCICQKYGIKKGRTENMDLWKARIIYSVCGLMGYASLWDNAEEGNVSMIHMKRRMQSILECYMEMYPEIAGLFPKDIAITADHIYNIFQSAGVIYHMPNRISPSIRAEAKASKVILERGCALARIEKVSGVGTYRTSSLSETDTKVSEMFQLSEVPLAERWEQTIKRAKWSEASPDETAEFLTMRPPFTRGYWSGRMEKNGTVSLYRVGMPGGGLYYLYQYKEGKLLQSQLSEWQVKESRQRELANACLAANHALPPLYFHRDGEIVHVRQEYLLPPAELSFLKLYSWSDFSKEKLTDFQRVCAGEVFDAIQETLACAGFEFMEE